jgi:hypothetical protein
MTLPGTVPVTPKPQMPGKHNSVTCLYPFAHVGHFSQAIPSARNAFPLNELLLVLQNSTRVISRVKPEPDLSPGLVHMLDLPLGGGQENHVCICGLSVHLHACP